MKIIRRELLIVIGILFIIGSLLAFLSDGIASQLLNSTFWGVWLIFMGMTGIFQNYEHTMLNKNSYLGLSVLILYIASLITYIYLFKPAFVNDPKFYIFIILLVFLITGFAFGYTKFRKCQKAVEPYEKTLKMDPTDFTAFNNKGTVLAEFKAYPEAVKCFDKALEIDPENVEAMYNEGNVLAKMKIYQTASEYYGRALKIDPKKPEIWNNKGNTLTKLGKYQEAVDCYNKSLELDPKNAKVWYNKGNALQELGKDQEALECYNKTLELDPGFEFTKRANKIIAEN